ncbi:MAG: LysR family transcriptional regulator [Pseudomonadota bacterium]
MTKAQDRLLLLATFIRIAERGSISAAARDIGVSQAAASRQLASLERLLSTQLVQRSTQALSLTEAGERTLIEARSLIESWEALCEQANDQTEALGGALKVVAPVVLGQTALASAAADFLKMNGDIRLTWLLDDGPIRFAETGCDLWIRAGEPDDDRLIVREIALIDRVVVAAPSLTPSPLPDPATLGELPFAAVRPFEGEQPLLYNPSGDFMRLSVKVSLSTDNLMAALQTVRDGAAFCIAPFWLVADELASGALVTPLPDWAAQPLTLTASFLPARRTTRRLRALIDHLSASILKLPGVEPV